MKTKYKISKTQLLKRRVDAAILLCELGLDESKTYAEIETNLAIAQAKRLLAQKSVNLSQHVDKIRRAWERHVRMHRIENGFDEWEGGPSPYPREVMDDQIIVDNDDKLWSVPYTMDDEKVVFGKPQRVKVEYREVAGAPAIKAITEKQALAAAKKLDPTATGDLLAWIAAQLMVADGFTTLICKQNLPHLPCSEVVM